MCQSLRIVLRVEENLYYVRAFTSCRLQKQVRFCHKIKYLLSQTVMLSPRSLQSSMHIVDLYVNPSLSSVYVFVYTYQLYISSLVIGNWDHYIQLHVTTRQAIPFTHPKGFLRQQTVLRENLLRWPQVSPLLSGGSGQDVSLTCLNGVAQSRFHRMAASVRERCISFFHYSISALNSCRQ